MDVCLEGIPERYRKEIKIKYPGGPFWANYLEKVPLPDHDPKEESAPVPAPTQKPLNPSRFKSDEDPDAIDEFRDVDMSSTPESPLIDESQRNQGNESGNDSLPRVTQEANLRLFNRWRIRERIRNQFMNPFKITREIYKKH